MSEKEINEMEAGPEMDALIAAFMEPKPEPITARLLRAREMLTEWYSTHYALSPNRWWRAEIGTAFNMDSHCQFKIERDDELVEWKPAREASTDIADAWQIVEKIRETGLSQRFADIFAEETPWHWCFLSTDAFCLHVYRAALKAISKQA